MEKVVELPHRGKKAAEAVTEAARRRWKSITNVTLSVEGRKIANIPVATYHDDSGRVSLKNAQKSFSQSFYHSSYSKWYNVVDSSPLWLKRVGSFLNRISRIPRSLHIHSLIKHATRRQEKTRQMQEQIEEEDFTRDLFQSMDDIEPQPVRFIYFVTLLQIIIFIIQMAVGDIAPTGYGLEKHEYHVPYFGNLFINQAVTVPKNIWYGTTTESLIAWGAKYTPCMRPEPIFDDNRKLAVDADKTLECCFKVGGDGTHCGLMSVADCGSSGGFRSGNSVPGKKCSLYAFEGCDAVDLRPCCYYINNQCTVTSREHCAVLPNGVFHERAETCEDVNCELDSCGMGSTGHPNPQKPNQFWRLFTPIFIHVGVGHLVLNLFAQVVIGGDIESVAGAKNTAIMYILSGVGGNIVASLFSPTIVSAGASSSIYGLMGVQVVDLIQSWALVDHKALQAIRVTLSTIIVLGVGTLPWIDNWAHVGGFFVGIVTGFAFLPHMHFSDKDRVRKALLTIEARVVLLAIFIGLLVTFYLVDSPEFCTWCKYVNCVPYTDGLCDYK